LEFYSVTHDARKHATQIGTKCYTGARLSTVGQNTSIKKRERERERERERDRERELSVTANTLSNYTEFPTVKD
jgi:hypothetical protein